jgi:hypothetical protein
MLANAPLPTTNTLQDWAQWYAAQGWPVFPCRGKVPRTLHGFHDATVDPFQIAVWWRQWPDANIGMACEPTRFVLDVDPRNGGDDTLFALERQYGMLPHTLLAHTGGGGNHYHWTATQPVRHHAPLGDGLDVQAQGGYVIMPPSLHPDTGKLYLWDVIDGPEDILPQPAPAWLEALLVAAAPSPTPTLPPDAPILEGERDNTLARMAITMHRAGVAPDAIRAALTVTNARCVPPLADADLDRITASASRYEPHPVLQGIGGVLPVYSMLGAAPQAANEAAWGNQRPALHFTDLADMLEREYPIPTWLIKELIPEGLTFFVGSPKSSKTYLAYSLALSLAYEAQRGGQWLGQYPILNPGPVVYLSLEDDEADSRLRIGELAPWLKALPRDQFLFVHGADLPRFNEGLIDVLREQVVERYHPALVVLDPISYLYTPIKKAGDQFSEVKDMLLPLRWLGKTYHTTILAVDHRRKKSAEDVDIIETTYGSNAKIAVADSILVIVRDDKEITIHARVRKASDQTLTLDFVFEPDGTAHWTWKGSTTGLLQTGQYGDLRTKTLATLATTPFPMSVEDVLLALNIPVSQQTRNSVKQILWRALKAQEVQKTTRGQYVWSGGN